MSHRTRTRRDAARIAALPCALAVAAALFSCAPPPGPPDVLLVLIDTLRADHLACYGDPEARTPMLDRLARRGAQFRCQAQAPWTLPAASTILSGLYPAAHGVNRVESAVPKSLRLVTAPFTENGYATCGIVSHTLVGSERGFARAFDSFDDGNALGHMHVSSDSVTALAIDWLDDVVRPFFLFLHYFDPHYAYVDHPGWTAPIDYSGPFEPVVPMADLRKNLRSLTGEDIRFVRNLYRGEIHLLDGALRRLFRYLETRGLDRDLAVVVVADHGEEFLEHGWLGHTRNLGQVLLDVPLLVSAPGRVSPGLREDRAMQVDVAPTLLDLASFPDEGTPGRSLLEPPGDRALYSEVTFDGKRVRGAAYERKVADGLGKEANQRALRVDRWKIVHDRREETWHLFDLESDPGEFHDLADERPDVREELRAALEHAEGAVGDAAVDSVTFTDEEIERLRGLGYVN